MTDEQRQVIWNKWKLNSKSKRRKAVYCIKDCQNKLIFISSTTNIYQRMSDCYSWRYINHAKGIQYKWMIKNFGNYTIDILEFCDNMNQQEINKRVESYISRFKDGEIKIERGFEALEKLIKGENKNG